MSVLAKLKITIHILKDMMQLHGHRWGSSLMRFFLFAHTVYWFLPLQELLLMFDIVLGLVLQNAVILTHHILGLSIICILFDEAHLHAVWVVSVRACPDGVVGDDFRWSHSWSVLAVRKLPCTLLRFSVGLRHILLVLLDVECDLTWLKLLILHYHVC